MSNLFIWRIYAHSCILSSLDHFHSSIWEHRTLCIPGPDHWHTCPGPPRWWWRCPPQGRPPGTPPECGQDQWHYEDTRHLHQSLYWVSPGKMLSYLSSEPHLCFKSQHDPRSNLFRVGSDFWCNVWKTSKHQTINFSTRSSGITNLSLKAKKTFSWYFR